MLAVPPSPHGLSGNLPVAAYVIRGLRTVRYLAALASLGYCRWDNRSDQERLVRQSFQVTSGRTLALTALSLTPCHPPSASVLSLHPCRLVFPRCRSSERKNKPTPAEGKKHEIRRSQPQDQRSRGLSSCSRWSPGRVQSSRSISERWRSFATTASATSCSLRGRSQTLPTLPDTALGLRLAASSGVAKRAFSFSPRWSATSAIKMRMRNRIPMPRRLSARCTVSGACMCSTDYLVICGRASARSMDSASATLESPLDSSKHIIAQLLCRVQHSRTRRSSHRPLLATNLVSEQDACFRELP